MISNKNLTKVCLLVLLVCFLAINFAHAQRLTGTIRGTVKDDTGEVLPGVTVEIQSPSLIGGSKFTVSTASGVYLFPGLAPGTYSATFSLEGFQTFKRENIVVSVGKTASVDIVLNQATVEETVTVIGESPVVDVTKSGTSANYNLELMENVPKSRFTYIDIMLWAPGVSANETQGEEWHSSLGSAYFSDSYLVDGIDTSFDWNGTTWVWNNPDIYQEGEVISIGAPAEYGNFQGAVVNVVTKSGSNSFQGDFNTYILPSSFVDNNVPDSEFPYHVDYQQDFSLEISGPLKKDKIWIYSNFQWKRSAYSQLGTDPKFPTKADYKRGFIKSTIQLNKNNKLVISYQHEKYDLPDVITPATPYDAAALEPGWYLVPNLLWTSVLSSNAIFELKLGGWFAHDEWVPMDGNLDESTHYDGATGFSTVGIWGWSKGDASRIQANATLSYYADEFIQGNHDFKVGVQFSRGHNAGVYSYSGGVAYYDYDGYPYYAYFQNPYNYGLAVNKIGVFMDDSWSVSDRLTLNLGLRFDHQNGDIFDVDEIDVNRNPTGNTIQGLSNVLSWNNISPRLGLVYQLTSDKKTIFRATYGHYYEGMYLATFFALSPSSQPVNAYEYNWDTEKYDIFSWSWNPLGGRAVGDDLKSSLCRQASVGLSHELFTDFGIEVTYVHKYTKGFLSWWNTSAQFEQVDFFDEFAGKTIKVWNQTTDPGDDFLKLINHPDFKQKYQGLFISLNKRLSHNWQMSSSLVISKASGVSSTGQLTQGNFSGLRDPNDLINNSGYDGLLQSDRKYMFKLQGTYFFPYDFNVSASYMAMSGKPIARTISVTGMDQGAFSILAEPRGSNYRLDSWNLLDLRVEKVFTFSDRFRFRIAADIFNLFNEDTNIETLTTRGLAEDFLSPARITPPRRVQLVLRLSF